MGSERGRSTEDYGASGGEKRRGQSHQRAAMALPSAPSGRLRARLSPLLPPRHTRRISAEAAVLRAQAAADLQRRRKKKKEEEEELRRAFVDIEKEGWASAGGVHVVRGV